MNFTNKLKLRKNLKSIFLQSIFYIKSFVMNRLSRLETYLQNDLNPLIDRLSFVESDKNFFFSIYEQQFRIKIWRYFLFTFKKFTLNDSLARGHVADKLYYNQNEWFGADYVSLQKLVFETLFFDCSRRYFNFCAKKILTERNDTLNVHLRKTLSFKETIAAIENNEEEACLFFQSYFSDEKNLNRALICVRANLKNASLDKNLF